MQGDDVPPVFPFDYEVQASDLSEWVAADRGISRRRLRCVRLSVIFALVAGALTALAVTVNHNIAACYLPVRGPDTPMWMWMCSASPAGHVPLEALVIAATALNWYTAAANALRARSRVPARLGRAWLNSPGMAGRYHGQATTSGLATTRPDGSQTLLPWHTLTSIQETDTAFILSGPDTRIRTALPKRALPNPALAPALSDFIRAAITPVSGKDMST